MQGDARIGEVLGAAQEIDQRLGQGGGDNGDGQSDDDQQADGQEIGPHQRVLGRGRIARHDGEDGDGEGGGEDLQGIQKLVGYAVQPNYRVPAHPLQQSHVYFEEKAREEVIQHQRPGEANHPALQRKVGFDARSEAVADQQVEEDDGGDDVDGYGEPC